MSPRPKLSVLLLCYNQKPFISQAVEGILLQRVDFTWEVVIADDRSTDGTREFVQSIAEKHSDLVRVLARERNLGAVPNLLRAIPECRGEYIAFIEGDDYWTRPDKLQAQVRFLDENPSYTICAHRVIDVDERRHVSNPYPRVEKEFSVSLRDLVVTNVFRTVAMIIRSNALPQNLNALKEFFLADWPLCLLALEKGPGKMMKEIGAVYRVHSQGIWSALDNRGRTRKRMETMVQMIGVGSSRLSAYLAYQARIEMAALPEEDWIQSLRMELEKKLSRRPEVARRLVCLRGARRLASFFRRLKQYVKKSGLSG